MIRRTLATALLLSLTIPTLAAAQKPAAKAEAPVRTPSAARTRLLDKLVATLVPQAPIVSLAVNSTQLSYPAQLTRNRAVGRAEATAPGLRQAMTTAAIAHARDAAPRLAAALAAEARAYWDARLGDAELEAAVAYLDQPFFTRYQRMTVDIRAGDSLARAWQRAAAAIERDHPDTREHRQRRLAFAASPLGRRLTPQISAYQRFVAQRQVQVVGAVAREAAQAGEAAGQAYVARAVQIRNSI